MFIPQDSSEVQYAVRLFHLDGKEQHQQNVKEKKQDPGDGDDDDDDDEITEYEKTKRRELYQAYMKFEKKHGDRERIENVIINNRRQSYQKAIDTDP